MILHYKNLQFELYLPEEQIKKKVFMLASQINHDYQGKEVTFVAILKGSFVFAADLLRNITLPCHIDFIKAASYVGETSSGNLEIQCNLSYDLTGKHVVILEDIIDTGFTMTEIQKYLLSKNPASLRTACLFDKKECRLVEYVPVEYVGFEIPNLFIIGYGLDYDGYGRNLPGIFVKKQSTDE